MAYLSEQATQSTISDTLPCSILSTMLNYEHNIISNEFCAAFI